ncbi:MAG: 2-hydroxyacid dehydrogenase [Gammaproteobacteria bacterium]|nr:2-hydroxyacid dehydrogenase [Gammaproteobacteria bacterium]
MKPFKVAVFSSKPYDKESFSKFKEANIECQFFDVRLTEQSVELAKSFDAVCAFVNDELSNSVLNKLKSYDIKGIALRCAGFNNLDLPCLSKLAMHAARVPAYSPEAVAEHTVALMMTLNRRLHKAYNRTKEDNFSLNGLLGFNIHGKTVGLIGTGKIGIATAKIMRGFGAKVLAYDPYPSDEAAALGCHYTDLNTLLTDSDIISLHCPLTEQSHHIINQKSVSLMKQGVMIINTSRGGLIDTQAMINGLKNGQIGHLALDVYEQESELFFEDHSTSIVQDDVFQRLLTFPNVLITGHQGFFTEEALAQIAQTTMYNLRCFAQNIESENEIVC